ncbi:MAG: PD-(D/E)XK nuclease domain-containing protein, partial [Lachnospiraceae bacterium]|nr:PD-(D/E)XK nuclease domain-containing protein [Lachnospiraceae bacterium]
KIQENIEKFMLLSVAALDTGSEAFYHGMMLGFCALFSNQYYVRSNREAGLGRFDIQLMPQQKLLPGFLLEFKYTKDEGKELSDLAVEALEQIDDKKYDIQLQEVGVKQIVKIGIAFRGKNAVVKCSH